MPDKRANIVVFKKKNKLLEHKKILIILAIILLAVPLTVFLAQNRQSFLNYADAGAIIETIEVSPGSVITDVNSTEPVYISTLAYDSFGEAVYYLDVNYEWNMSSTNSVGTLSKTSGEITEFWPLNYGCGELIVTASWGQEVVTKAIQVAVSDGENIPNCTGIPTPTTVQNPAVLEFQSVKLHGIGSGGDNTNSNSPGNINPLRTSREIKVELEDSNGEALPVIDGVITYATSSGDFSGEILLPGSISPGSYIVKVKSPQYLKKQVSGIIEVVSGETIEISKVSLITGDVYDNNMVDLVDYSLLIDCYADLLPARDCDDDDKKMAADLSDDGFVNADDYNLFLRELSVLIGD